MVNWFPVVFCNLHGICYFWDKWIWLSKISIIKFKCYDAIFLFLFFNLQSVEVANASSFLCSCRRHIFWISKQILTIYTPEWDSLASERGNHHTRILVEDLRVKPNFHRNIVCQLRLIFSSKLGIWDTMFNWMQRRPVFTHYSWWN